MLNTIYRGAEPCDPAEITRAEIAAHLQRARDLLAEPGAWIQEDYARDNIGETVDSCSQAAGRFCSSGALFAAALPGDCTVSARALLARAIGGDIEIWNDAIGRTPDEVLRAFDLAIVFALEAETTLGDTASGKAV